MPLTSDDAERHTHKATTWALKELWAKVANECLERMATKAARSGKRTPSSRGRRKAPTSQDSSPAVTPVTNDECYFMEHWRNSGNLTPMSAIPPSS